MDAVKQKTGQVSSTKAAYSWKQIADALTREMKRVSETRKCTKRTAVRLAIKNIIRADILEPGDLLPSEKELTGILGVSLGTVQAALGQLKALGAISRRRGDGSRVTDREPFDETVWHFKFLSKSDRSPLRIKDELLKIETISCSGVWSQYLGKSDKYLRIWRRLTMRDGTTVGAEMFLDHNAASVLASIDESELRMANIRPYLEETLGIATRGATHNVKTVTLDEAIASEYDLDRTEVYFEIHAKAHSPTGQPVYFQRIYVSTSSCILEF
jgi:DNA-binding GntR family transcriptional regulator